MNQIIRAGYQAYDYNSAPEIVCPYSQFELNKFTGKKQYRDKDKRQQWLKGWKIAEQYNRECDS